MPGYRVEPDLENPMHKAVFWRGIFIHRYSGFEVSVSELLVRASDREEYVELGQLPYHWNKKLARLSAVLDAPGPLQAYADRIRGMIRPLISIERQRHLLVHGLMSLHLQEDGKQMLYFKTFDRHEGDLGEITMWLSISDLETMTQEMGAWVSSFVHLLVRIFRELGFPPMASEDRVPLEGIERHI